MYTVNNHSVERKPTICDFVDGCLLATATLHHKIVDLKSW